MSNTPSHSPGTVLFYDKFLAWLAGRLGCGVFGVSYACHALEAEKVAEGGRVEAGTLEGQLRHKRAFLDWLGRDKRFVLVGHSIGCYLTERLAARSGGRYNVEACVHLMPFHRFDPDKTLDRLGPQLLAKVPTVVRGLGWALERVVSAVPDSALLSAMKASGSVVNTHMAVRLVKAKGYFDRFLTLGADEIGTLGPDLDVELVKDMIQGTRQLSVLYARNDMWASVRHLKHLRSLLQCGYVGVKVRGGKESKEVIGGEVHLEVLEGIKHDFPVREGCERVAEWALKEILKVEGQQQWGRGLSKL